MPIHNLLPNGDGPIESLPHPNGVAVVGSVGMAAALFDNNLGTYVVLNPNNDYAWGAYGPAFIVAMSSFVLTAGEVVKSVDLHVLASSNAYTAAFAAGFATNQWWLTGHTQPDGVSQGYLPVPVELAGGDAAHSLTGTPIWYVSPPQYVSPPNAPGYYSGAHWTQADLDNLNVGVTWRNGDTQSGPPPQGGGAAYIYEIYATVLSALPPSVTVQNPTGTYTISNPTVTWTYAQGTDGSAQQAYRVKVFTLAQYSAGGFDPATSVATWDTGVVNGSAASRQIGILLANTTFRAYVEVAQVTAGVTQWSPWAFSQFIINVAGPGAPTIVDSPNPTLGRIDLTVTKGANPAWTLAQVQRSVDGGTTWVDVRDYAMHDVTGLTSVSISDYEAPPDTAVIYRARGLTVAAGGTIAGDWSASTSAKSWALVYNLANCDGAVAWLKNPLDPNLNMLVRLGPGSLISKTRRISRGVFDILGRQNPVVVSDSRRSIETTLTILTMTVAEEARVIALFASATTLLLQAPDVFGWASAYISAGDLVEEQSIPNISRSERRFTVPIGVTDAPVGIPVPVVAVPVAPAPPTHSAFASAAAGIGTANAATTTGTGHSAFATTATGAGAANAATTTGTAPFRQTPPRQYMPRREFSPIASPVYGHRYDPNEEGLPNPPRLGRWRLNTRPFSAASPFNIATPGGTTWFDHLVLHQLPDATTHRWYMGSTAGEVWFGHPTDPIWTVDVPDYIYVPSNRNRLARKFQIRGPENMAAGLDSDHIFMHVDATNGELTEVWDASVDQQARYITCLPAGPGWSTGNVLTSPGAGTLGGLNDGVRAANFSWLAGMITSHDLTTGVIDHALGIALPYDMLKGGGANFIAPATSGDFGGWGGPIWMGSKIGVPAGTAQPAGLTHIGTMLWTCLITYGMYVGDFCGGPYAQFYVDANTVTEAQCHELYAWWDYGNSADWDKIQPFTRVANYQP